jgi:hypothetical protein
MEGTREGREGKKAFTRLVMEFECCLDVKRYLDIIVDFSDIDC